jgi:Circadian oscillating protein COP23
LFSFFNISEESMMSLKFSATLLMTALTISSSLVLTSEVGFSQPRPTAKSNATTFACVRQGAGYATVARRGSRQTGAMITWNSNAFGPQYTPEKRCKAVGDRLTKAVAASGGRLSSLKITNGVIGSSSVICYINSTRELCNSNNLILTLNQSDSGQEAEIMKQLASFSVNGTGTPLTRAADGRTIVRLGVQIDKALEANSTTGSSPQQLAPTPTPTTPSTNKGI